MAIDSKYGRVTLEKGTIGEDEPVVVFRAQDKLLPEVLSTYATLCEKAGSPEAHVEAMEATREAVLAWQRENHTQVPQSTPAE